MVRIRKKNRRGAATVEMAIVLPLLLMLTMGGIKYGWLFLRAQQITNAARYGARIAILPDADSDEVKETVITLLAAANITVDNNDITITTGDLYLPEGGSVKVQITIPGDRVDIWKAPFCPDVGNIGASVTMAKEGS